MKKIILASGSPRRRDILTEAGLDFEVFVSDADEVTTETIPARVVEDLAGLKAEDALKKLTAIDKSLENCIILAADTVVSYNGNILGKPKDKNDAFRTLKLLSGKKHEVYTGVALLDNINLCNNNSGDNFSEGISKTEAFSADIFSIETKVEFCELSDTDILEYIATGEPMDKAGSYAVQSPRCAKFIKGIEGDYWNVVGLPIGEILRRISLS